MRGAALSRRARDLALFAAALIVGVVVAYAVAGAITTHQVRAIFQNADGLVAGNSVKIAGVGAGTVDSVRVEVGNGSQEAVAVLSIDSTHWPLHQGTTVAVRPKGVLSNVYVDVTPGSAYARALPDGYTFMEAQTQSPVDLTQLNNVFTPGVRTAIRTQLEEGVLALGGSGAPDLNQTIANLDPLLRDAVPITDVLAQRVPQLDALNHEFDQVSGDLAREDANLRPLIVNADVTLGALATQQEALQGTLVNASGSLQSLAASLHGETANLERIFQEGPAALQDAEAAANYLTPLIAAVNPHIPDLDVLLNEFVTATGYSGDPQAVDTLRIDPTTPEAGHSAMECGGEPAQQQSACPGAPRPSTGY